MYNYHDVLHFDLNFSRDRCLQKLPSRSIGDDLVYLGALNSHWRDRDDHCDPKDRRLFLDPTTAQRIGW
jgi:hypothetical protein